MYSESSRERFFIFQKLVTTSNFTFFSLLNQIENCRSQNSCALFMSVRKLLFANPDDLKE